MAQAGSRAVYCSAVQHIAPWCASQQLVLGPSAKEPFVFLWDEKVGGSTFNRWLLESSAHEDMLEQTHISDFGWTNIIGSPYFLKMYGEERRRELSIVAGNFDWRVMHGNFFDSIIALHLTGAQGLLFYILYGTCCYPPQILYRIA